MPFNHRYAFVHETHLQHQPGCFHQNFGAFPIAGFERAPDFQRAAVVRQVEVMGRQTVIPLDLVGFRLHHPLVFTHHRIGVAGRLVERHQAPTFGHVRLTALKLFVELDRLPVLLGLDQCLDTQAQKFLVARITLHQIFKQGIQLLGLAVGLGEQRQRVQAIHADRRFAVGQPGLLAGQLVLIGLQRPLRQPQVLPVQLAVLGARLVQRNCPLGATKKGQNHGGLVAELLIAPAGEFLHGRNAPPADFHHRQARLNQPLLVTFAERFRGAAVPIAGLFRFSAGIQEAGLQQQRVGGRRDFKRLVRRRHGFPDLPVAPLQLRDRQMKVGLRRGR